MHQVKQRHRAPRRSIADEQDGFTAVVQLKVMLFEYRADIGDLREPMLLPIARPDGTALDWS